MSEIRERRSEVPFSRAFENLDCQVLRSDVMLVGDEDAEVDDKTKEAGWTDDEAAVVDDDPDWEAKILLDSEDVEEAKLDVED